MQALIEWLPRIQRAEVTVTHQGYIDYHLISHGVAYDIDGITQPGR